MRKGLFSSLAAVVAAGGVLVGCGGGTASREDAPAPSRASVAVNAEPAEAADVLSTPPRLLLRLRPSALKTQALRMSQEALVRLNAQGGQRIEWVRQAALDTLVVSAPEVRTKAGLSQLAQKLSKLKEVEFAEPDHRAQIAATANDPGFAQQWFLAEPERVAGGINAVGAWDLTRGSESVVVAVVDTGVLDHPDIHSRLLPGYDFISDSRASNDGGGRDADARDAGDYITTAEAASYGRTSALSSSWHGTHVAGIVAAQANNGQGIAGIASAVRVLPVRVLGKGGGSGADIADGIVWAAGGAVPGVPANPYPAKIINLSLGGAGSCSRTYQNAIDFARSQGAVVVVAAGNSATLASNFAPANCAGVISVGATGKSGAQASYSNYGSGVTLSAPGGDDDALILSLGDGGSTTPRNDGTTLYAAGTSMAAPVVSATAALVLSLNPALTPDQVKQILTNTVSAFKRGTGRDCSLSLCGAGQVNALSAVRAAAAGEVGATLAAPQSGWWWNAGEGGRGYAIEIRNGGLFMAGFLYERNGDPTWFVVNGPMSDARTFSGQMLRYEAGQTLTGSYKSPNYLGEVGAIRLEFSSATAGRIFWPDGSSTSIQRYDIVSGGSRLPQGGFAPEAGWWWNASEGGRGFALEVQGDQIFMGGFMYDGNGRPTWYVTGGKMKSATSYEGSWLAYRGGQAIGQPYQAPSLVPVPQSMVRLSFSDARNAQLTLPDGRQLALSRYLGFGTDTPLLGEPEGVRMLKPVLGDWFFQYSILTSWTEDFTFSQIISGVSDEFEYFAQGLDKYDSLTLATYSSSAKSYYMYTLNPSWSSYDSFYEFTWNGPGTIASGCYYLVYRSTKDLSSCYTLTGMRLRSGGVQSRPPSLSEGQLAQALQMRLAEVQSLGMQGPKAAQAFGQTQRRAMGAAVPESPGEIARKLRDKAQLMQLQP